MWKKDDDSNDAITAPKTNGPAAPPTPAVTGSGTPGEARARGTATIGSAITIKGEVTGDEDLLIQGRVDGSIDLKEHAITIGADGSVTASVTARVVVVEGRVEGDIRAQERIVLRASSHVEGDITSPRVVLEDGARFRGGVDMGEAGVRGTAAGSAPEASPSADRSNGKSTADASSAATSTSASASSSKSSSGDAAKAPAGKSGAR